MSREAIVLALLICGVAAFCVAIVALLKIHQRAHRPPELHPMGDIPSLPEFIKRRDNIK